MERLLARLMQMDDAAWRRHASPWSVWTRVATLPVIVLAVWSRVWLGGWSLVPIAIVALWVWWNPRAFPAPRDTRNWGSKATFGERVWLARREAPIPRHHEIAARVLVLISLSGLPILIGGLISLQVWATLAGMMVTMLGKLWFCDRMVWLYEDMRVARPELREWEAGEADHVNPAATGPAKESGP
jgi:hypothetical protein